MAKKKKNAMTNSVDEDGFFHLTPIPGGKYDLFQRDFMGIRVPKSSDKFLYDLVDTYGVEKVINMTEVDIGNYIYHKGIVHALNMNVGRSIPWIEDGLKSGERRALYTMWRMKLNGGNKAKVSAIVGEMIKTVYPHGDQAAADTIYRLGRSRAMMIPYVVPGGDFGNMDVMRPASPRYASASLSPYAMDCFFSDIGPRAPLYEVKDNYDFSSTEPVFLTSRYPNMLMQWNQGIGKGAASWLGAFNSKDLFKAALQMLDDPNCKIDIYPDLPIPATIVNKAKLKGCFDENQFKVQIRAPYELTVYQRMENGRKVDVYAIIFTALPLSVIGQIVKNQIVEIKRQDEKSNNKRLPEVKRIDSVANDKTPGGIQFYVEYEKGYDPHVLVEKLYRMTSLSKTIGVQYMMVTDNQPIKFTPRQIMKQWIAQRFDQKRRLYNQKVLQAAKDRSRLEAVVRILDGKNTDIAINIIRKSKNKLEAVDKLKETFGFTDFQARMVMQIRLENLPRMSIEETIRERDQAIADYKHYRSLLVDASKVKENIRAELEEGLRKYGKPRIASVINLEENQIEDSNAKKWVFYDHEMYYCLNDPKELKKIAGNLNRNYQVIELENQDSIMIIDNKSGIKVLSGYSFSLNEQGISFNTLGVKNVVRILPFSQSKYTGALTITKNGYGKLMFYEECTKSDKGRLASLTNGDTLLDIIPITTTDAESDDNVMVGIIIDDNMYYVKLSEFPILKRASSGNRILKGMKELPNARIVYFDLAKTDQIMVYGESGYLKILDTMYLAFNKKKASYISLSGKNIIGAIGLRNGTDNKMTMYDAKGELGITIEVDKMVKFSTDKGESQKFKISTSIGNPVKVFKKTKNEYYCLLK